MDPNKVLNIGAAAHITAASKGGPRYDAALKPQERKSEANGIWLCQNHAKLVDNDERTYPVDLLRQWKRLSEQAALLDIEAPSTRSSLQLSDGELIRFYAQCFDRPAFQDHFHQEGSMEAFDRAIEDTITAINTGCLRSRDGAVLARAKGKAFLGDPKLRERMDVIVDLLRAIRSRYEEARRTGAIHVRDHPDGSSFYDIRDHEVAAWMDLTRSQILEMFGETCREMGVAAPIFPRHSPRRL